MSSESSVFSGEPTTFSSASTDAASETSSTTTTEIITPTSTTEQDTSQTETFNATTSTETINSPPTEPQSAPPTSPVSDTASTPSFSTTGLSSNDASSSTNTSLVDSETVVPTDVSNSTSNPSTSADSTKADSTSIASSAVPTEVTTTAPVETETSADPTSATSQPTSLPPTEPTTDTTIASPTDPTTIPPTGTTNVPPTDPTTTILTDSTTTDPTEPSTAPPTDSTTAPPTDTLTTEPTDPATVDTATTTDPTGSTVVSTDPTTPTDPTTSPPTETTTTEPNDPGTVVTVDSTSTEGSTTPPSDPTTVLTDTGLESVPASTSSPVNTSTPRGATTTSGDVAQQTVTTTSPTVGEQPTTSVVLTSVDASTGAPVSTAISASGTRGTLTVGSGITEGGTLTVSGSTVRETIDPHTEANVSEFVVLTQSAPERITAPSETVVTYVTTEFTTTTNSDGSVSVIPTKTNTVVGTITPTYSVQPNEFERNKGPILGLSIVAGILLLIAISIGIWVCRRRRRQVVGRRHNPSPIGDVVTGPVLIRGHSLPVEGSWEWRPPLVTEVGDDDHEDDVRVLAGQTPMNAMTEREGSRPSIPAPLMRANSYGSAEEGTRPPLDVEISSVGRSTESSRDTMQFTTSLLSFDTDPITPQIVTSRFSDTSSSQSAPRTASLISLSAEPTPLDGRFSMSSISIPESSGIPVISPFADSFSTEAARNSYWQNSSRSSRTSSSSSHESGPIRFNSSDQQCGWREVEMEDDLPSRMRGGRASTQDIVYQASDPFEDENTPSLMSQVSLISAQSPRNSAPSLLNPPLRPQWTGTLSSLGQRSGPSKAPSLPPIPAVASPALTDDSFHAEGLLADPAYAQSRSGGLDDPQRPGFSTHDSFSSLLDHVDYSMPITSNVNPFDDEITFSKLTRSEESSMCSETPESQPQNDFLNDVLPVLSVLQKRAQTSREALQTR